MPISVGNLFFYPLFFLLFLFALRLIKKSVSGSVGLCLTQFWKCLFPLECELSSQIDFAAFAHFHLIIFSVLCLTILDAFPATDECQAHLEGR